MGAPEDDHERTMAFAEIALGQIKALHQPATPRHFEIWYTYATGYNPSLNQTINTILSRDGTLSEAEIDRIYQAHFSSNRFTDRLESVGTKVKGEIDQVMAMIGAAIGSTSSYTEKFNQASESLGRTEDLEGIRAIVESLVQVTKEVERDNRALEARLSASKLEISELQENLVAVRNEGLTDPLTSLANRKFFDEALARSVAAAQTQREPLALLLADIDHFKTFNDRYGHLTGDQVLRLVALAVKQNVKSQDITARYGGEEFAIILPQTQIAGALRLAEGIRNTMMRRKIVSKNSGEDYGTITLSLGVALYRAGEPVADLVRRADAALYFAKRNGRNRVASEEEAPAEIAVPA